MPESSGLASSAPQLSCLQQINSLPLPLSDALFRFYPGMKMGLKTSVNYYADHLYPLVLATIEKTPGCLLWAITSPPIKHAPSGANLITWEIFSRLKQVPQYRDRVTLVDLKLPHSDLRIDNEQDYQTFHNYCSTGVTQRIAQRAQERQGGDDILAQQQQFKDRGVIVMNDIKVTGTQQQFMQDSFDQVPLACLHWLYIFEVNPVLGKKEPQIEAQINFSPLQSLQDFYALLSAPDITYTSKCIARLFSYQLPEFKALLQPLDRDKCRMILTLASGECRFNGRYFAEKFQLLNRLCSDPSTTRSATTDALQAIPAVETEAEVKIEGSDHV